MNWWRGYGGAGGGLTSEIGELPKTGRSKLPTAATQTSGGIGYDGNNEIVRGSFGQGADNFSDGPGGGGGYYGGAGSMYGASSGGSSYIGGVSYGYTISGNLSMPNYLSDGYIQGNKGNGHVRIIYLGEELQCSDIIGKEYIFSETNKEYEFVTKCAGEYKLEAWGAQGGSVSTSEGGYGSYSKGNVTLQANETLYINVGEAGRVGYDSVEGYVTVGSYNGGGGNTSSQWGQGSTGGGATHIATVSGQLSELEEYKGTYDEENELYKSDEILIVAGGGGGAGTENSLTRYVIPGHAGGKTSTSGNSVNYPDITPAKVASQNDGYQFGLGQSSNSWAGSGGGGFFGGKTQTGSGGSGYIANDRLTNKAMYCYNCPESDYVDTKTIQISTASQTPEVGQAKKGNGFAKITYLG